MSALEHAGVAPDYRHVEKVAHSEPSLALGGAIVKWYDIAPDDEPVPLAVRAVARRCLRDAARAGKLGALGELGFVILHRCEDDFFFLLVCTWCNGNELWETVWAKNGSSDVLFRPWSTEGPHRPTFCAWELGAVCHEREAWTRFLLSPRDEPARNEYLRDCFEGVV